MLLLLLNILCKTLLLLIRKMLHIKFIYTSKVVVFLNFFKEVFSAHLDCIY